MTHLPIEVLRRRVEPKQCKSASLYNTVVTLNSRKHASHRQPANF